MRWEPPKCFHPGLVVQRGFTWLNDPVSGQVALLARAEVSERRLGGPQPRGSQGIPGAIGVFGCFWRGSPSKAPVLKQ